MSYQDVARGAGTRELRPVSQGDGSTPAVKELVGAMFRLQTEVSRLKKDVDRLGSARDTLDLRHAIGQANQRVTNQARAVKEQLKQLSAGPGADAKQVAKLKADLETVLRDFQAVMRVARQREAASLPKAPEPPANRSEAPQDEVERQALMSQQMREVLKVQESEVDYNEALIEERDHEVVNIQQQIAEVNEIFQDLAVLVHDQGAMVDDIEANISHTAERSNDARREIVRAERYQRSNRNRKCILLLIAGGVLGVLLLVLLSS